MASEAYYTFYMTDEGEPATGLIPTITSFWGVESKTNYVGSPFYSTLLVEELGDGFYFIKVDWDLFDPSSGALDPKDSIFLLRIDAGMVIDNTNERYISLRIEQEDVAFEEAKLHREQMRDEVMTYVDAEFTASELLWASYFGGTNALVNIRFDTTDASLASLDLLIQTRMNTLDSKVDTGFLAVADSFSDLTAWVTSEMTDARDILLQQSGELYKDLKEDLFVSKAWLKRVLDIQEGNWVIEHNQLRLRDRSGNLLGHFNLYDFDKNPTMGGAYERVADPGQYTVINEIITDSDFSAYSDAEEAVILGS